MFSNYYLSLFVLILTVMPTSNQKMPDNDIEMKGSIRIKDKSGHKAKSNTKVIQSPKSCLDHLNNGETRTKHYLITTPSGQQTVYCDLTSERGSAWTLVLSYAMRYRFKSNILPFKFGLTRDLPVNSKTPNFNMYRMTHAQMKNIKFQSTHWRVTCSYYVDYRDYLRVKFADLDPLTFIGIGVCKKVEYINVRGHVGIGVTAAFWQYNHEMLHHDSSINRCQFGNSPNASSSEDNFGFYASVNKKFRCTAHEGSTSNMWFGSYL